MTGVLVAAVIVLGAAGVLSGLAFLRLAARVEALEAEVFPTRPVHDWLRGEDGQAGGTDG